MKAISLLWWSIWCYFWAGVLYAMAGIQVRIFFFTEPPLRSLACPCMHAHKGLWRRQGTARLHWG